MREFIRSSRSSNRASGSAEKHQSRETIINQDDLLNLKIALETSEDIMELFEDKHIFD